MNPKVSIIIPAYNAELYISQAIESALNQTERNLEIIVVDDGSTDSTVEIIKGFPDHRLKLFVNQQNRGASYSRNRAIKKAKGEWITPLDADDWYAPERLEQLLQAADRENADMVADDLYFMQDNAQEPVGTLFCVDQEYCNRLKLIDPDSFVLSNMKPARQSPHLGLTKPLLRRSLLTQYNLEYDGAVQPVEDYHLYMMCLLRGARFVTIPKPYYFYRRSRQGSISTQSRLRLLEQNRKSNLILLQEEAVKNHPDLSSLVEKYLLQIDKEIEYYTVIKILKKNKMPWKTVEEIMHEPKLFQSFLKQIPKILRRRLNYYINK